MKAVDQSVVSDQEPVLNKWLRIGIRKALDGGRGQLRMDTEDLAKLLGSAIDAEVERLARVRASRERRRQFRQRLAVPGVRNSDMSNEANARRIGDPSNRVVAAQNKNVAMLAERLAREHEQAIRRLAEEARRRG